MEKNPKLTTENEKRYGKITTDNGYLQDIGAFFTNQKTMEYNGKMLVGYYVNYLGVKVGKYKGLPPWPETLHGRK